MGELIQKTIGDSDLTVVTVKGVVSSMEIIAETEKYYNGKPSRFLLFDFREADVSGITAENLRSIAHVSKRTMHSRKNAKTAIVVKGEAAYGMGRMFETFVELESLSVAFNIFRDYQEAIDWIQSEDE